MIKADTAALVNASASSAVLSLTSKVQSSSGNYLLSTSVTYDTAHFASASFSANASGATLTGGVNATGGTTIFDSGTVNLAVGGFTASASYGQSSNSTGTQVATALASALNVAGSPVTATAAGASVAMTYKTAGAAGNTPVSVTSTTGQPANFATGSFSGSATLANGSDQQPGSLSNPYVTLYVYDTLNNLTCVEQRGNAATGTGCSAPPASDATSPWRIRRFTYNALSQLLTARNPESGTISYSYDNDGNLLQKTSPAPNQTGTATQTISYCYDALHRMTGKVYSAQTCPLTSPVVSYTYDVGTNGIGYQLSLIGYSLMSNHVHLIVIPTQH